MFNGIVVNILKFMGPTLTLHKKLNMLFLSHLFLLLALSHVPIYSLIFFFPSQPSSISPSSLFETQLHSNLSLYLYNLDDMGKKNYCSSLMLYAEKIKFDSMSREDLGEEEVESSISLRRRRDSLSVIR